MVTSYRFQVNEQTLPSNTNFETMIGKPLLSIILPVYNKRQYLKKCIDSIFRQKFSSFELVIINDGSTDDSEEIIKEYTDERIRYYSYANRGVSTARNLGLNFAEGEYVLFIDADDWIDADYLEQVMLFTKENNTDLYVWGITKDRQDNSTEVLMPVLNGYYTKNEFLREFVCEQYLKRKGLYGYISNKLLRTSIIRENNIRFNPNLRLLEDYDFFLSYYRCCENICVIPYAGYHYVAGTSNSSGLLNKNVNYLSIIDVHLKCYKILVEVGALTNENKSLILNAVGALVQASFLEMRPVKIKKIVNLLEQLKSREYAYTSFQMIKTKYRLLKKFIIQQKALLIYLYLIIWRVYIYLRTI